jgi:hypothetical protein
MKKFFYDFDNWFTIFILFATIMFVTILVLANRNINSDEVEQLDLIIDLQRQVIELEAYTVVLLQATCANMTALAPMFGYPEISMEDCLQAMEQMQDEVLAGERFQEAYPLLDR